MKRLTFLVLLVGRIFAVSGQKPCIDSTVFDKWSESLSPDISYDGKYSQCLINVDKSNANDLTISANLSTWKIKIRGVKLCSFSANSRYSYFINEADSLGIITLGTNHIEYIANVKSFKLSGDKEKEWLAYSTKGNYTTIVLRAPLNMREERFTFVSDYSFCEDGNALMIVRRDTNSARRTLILYDLKNTMKLSLRDIIDYTFSDKGRILLVSTESMLDTSTFPHLLWVNLKKKEIDTIAYVGKPRNHFFNTEENAVTFIASAEGEDSNCLYYYKEGMGVAKKLTDVVVKVNKYVYSVVASTPSHWSISRDKLLVQMRKERYIDSSTIKGSSNVSIWNYKDERLPKEQYYDKDAWFLIDLNDSNRVTQVTREHESILNLTRFDKYLFIVGYRISSDMGVVSRYYRVNAKDGSRKLIGNEKRRKAFWSSPGGSFVIWYDADSLCYFTYNLISGKTTNISHAIPLSNADSSKIGKVIAYGIAGWTINDRYVFVYDQYDIWRLDQDGIDAPENVTNYCGKRMKVTFGLVNWDLKKVIDERKELLLSGYNNVTKYNGFWKFKYGLKSDPVRGSMDPQCYYVVRTGRVGIAESAVGERPIKAGGADKYLVRRMDAAHFPNYYFTSDFRSYKPITDYYPEKAYNWLTAQLINWTMLDGEPSQGILYKPENFDSTKKYPLIFDCYEKRSDQLNEFISPKYSYDRINIPYYVSNGYLVFVPDIYYSKGHNDIGVLNSVVSAAKYLSSLPYVDTTRLGLQGHSFGGWETNLLVTRTQGLFAAACEASGMSDEMSAYDEVSHNGSPSQLYYEDGGQASPFGIGVTPWTDPGLYMANSPVFYVKGATTPLLLVAGTNDDNVPFPQAVEMYLAMKRAGKKVWLLEYENAGHSVFGDDARDYTIRMKQYFDFYLKGSLPPKWMTKGVPAIRKGVESGLELDQSGQQP